jgi:putative transposase
VKVKNITKVLDDLKTVYTQDTLENAETALDYFINIWDKRYPKVAEKFKNNSSLFILLSFPKEIRVSIYTTNLIEGFNKYLKRKEQFPNEDSLIRFICSYAGDPR